MTPYGLTLWRVWKERTNLPRQAARSWLRVSRVSRAFIQLERRESLCTFL